jgi:hypothetical protein
MQGQLRGLYVPCPSLSSAFRHCVCGPFHIDFGRRLEQHAAGLVGAIELVKFASFPALRHLFVVGMADFPRPDDALLAALKVIAISHRQRRQRPTKLAFRPQFPNLEW